MTNRVTQVRAAQALAVTFLREQGIAVMGMDFGGDEATFGWVFEVLAMITAGLALWLALTMRE